MKSGVKLFTIVQISICLVVSATQSLKSQELWNDNFTLPGAYNSDGDVVNDMIVSGDGFFLTGYFGSIDGIQANSIAYWNGTGWEVLGKGLQNEDGSIAEGYELHINNGLLYVVGDFKVAGDLSVTNLAVWDIAQQKWVTIPGEINGIVRTVTSSGSNVFVGGDFTEINGSPYDHIAVWDGESWSAFQGGVNGAVNVLKRSSGQLYVGGDFTSANGLPVNNLAIWTGTEWTDFNGGSNGEIFEIHIKGDSVLVGGDFTELNGTAISYLGILNEGTWTAFPVQPNDAVHNIKSEGTEIIITGEFEQIGVLQTNGFAIWDGNSWEVPNNELEAFFRNYTMILYEENWIIGGSFLGSEEKILNNIALLDDNMEWSNFGLQKDFFGINGAVLTIEADDKTLYLGGAFDGIGNKPIGRLARWNGSNWETLGESPNGSVNDILIDENLVYVAGTFTTIGGISANRIAVWDTNTEQWSALKGGASSSIRSLLKIGNSLYAAGSFTQMDGINVNRIAEWDGNDWNALDIGVDGTIRTMLEYNGKIYVGGDFNNAGAVAANYFAAWNGASWENVDTGLDGSVYALAKTDTSIFIGGDFENSPTGVARNIVEWVSESNSWIQVGNGLDNRVQSLFLEGDSLFAGGRFNKENQKGVVIIGGNNNTELNGIALWDKTDSWTNVGSGFSTFTNSTFNVYSIKRYNDELYIGGYFDFAGEIISNNIALWNESKVSISTEETEVLPKVFTLHQNYPNPFNPSTNISFELTESGPVKLTIYNLLGQEISTLVNERLNAGSYDFTFDASGLASGIYLYRIQSNSMVLTKKMMLLK
ncbi:MAG: T9SS type A sorting domain-containing protein [Balneola sp.]